MGSETIRTKNDLLCFSASDDFFSMAFRTSSRSLSSFSSSVDDFRTSVAKSEMIFQAISINNYQMFLSIEKENVIIDCQRKKDKDERI